MNPLRLCHLLINFHPLSDVPGVEGIPEFLADRTKGRAIATVFRLSVYLSSLCDVMYCG